MFDYPGFSTCEPQRNRALYRKTNPTTNIQTRQPILHDRRLGAILRHMKRPGACAFEVAALLTPVAGQSAQPGLSKLAGTWQLDKSKGMLPGGSRTFDSMLTVEVTDDVVTTKRTGIVPADAGLNVYEVDGQAHSELFGDMVPQQLRTRTATWLKDVDGFEVVEGRATSRWTVSSDSQQLTIETTLAHPCPPCSPANPQIDHTVYVFARVRD